MADYISREALLEKAWDADTRAGYVQVVDVGDILAEPAADVVPVVHGRWVDNGIQGSMLRGCSVCSFTCGSNSFFYCPSCGAKMDGGE